MLVTLHETYELVKEAFSEWTKDKAPRMGAALAYYTSLSLAPLIIITFSIIALIYGDDAARGQVSREIQGLVGSQAAEVVEEVLANSKQPSAGALAMITGLVTLLFGASGVFGELQDAMNTVWRVRPKSGQGIWAVIRSRFLSFAMVLGIGFLLLVSLVLSAFLAALGEYTSNLFPGVAALMEVLNSIVTFSVFTVLFGLMFKVLPDAKIGWRDVWLGAATTAALFTVGKMLIGLYLGSSGVGSAYGAAGSLIAFLVWIYYATQILIFGAELTKVRLLKSNRTIEPKEGAETVPEEGREMQGGAFGNQQQAGKKAA